MRILLVHNFYGSASPSGENQVFINELDLLKANGHEVLEFVSYSDDILNKSFLTLFRAAIKVPWNNNKRNEISNVVKKFNPDVVHIHNTFPLLSPSIFYGLGTKALVVMTLHNYRIFCPAAIPLRESKICTKCLDMHTILPAIKYGCYRQSRIATLPIAFNIALHRFLRTWKTKVDIFIALSDFQREKLSLAGLPLDKITVKPNFKVDNFIPVEWNLRGSYIVFVGRLSEEKGLYSLINAWKLWFNNKRKIPELMIIGDGPLRSKLEILAKGLPIKFLGYLSPQDTQLHIAKSKLLIIPSECFEGFPMVIVEAFALATPIAVSNLGPLPLLTEKGSTGLVFESNNPISIMSIISKAWYSKSLLRELVINS